MDRKPCFGGAFLVYLDENVPLGATSQALPDVAVIFDAEVGEVALVGAADAVDDELALRDVVKAGHRASVVECDVLLLGQVDRVFHCLGKADLLRRFAPAVGK